MCRWWHWRFVTSWPLSLILCPGVYVVKHGTRHVLTAAWKAETFRGSDRNHLQNFSLCKIFFCQKCLNANLIISTQARYFERIWINRVRYWNSGHSTLALLDCSLDFHRTCSYERNQKFWKSRLFPCNLPLHCLDHSIREISDLRRCPWWHVLLHCSRLEQNVRGKALVRCCYASFLCLGGLFWINHHVLELQSLRPECLQVVRSIHKNTSSYCL